jgi:hypothetical protein
LDAELVEGWFLSSVEGWFLSSVEGWFLSIVEGWFLSPKQRCTELVEVSKEIRVIRILARNKKQKNIQYRISLPEAATVYPQIIGKY